MFVQLVVPSAMILAHRQETLVTRDPSIGIRESSGYPGIPSTGGRDGDRVTDPSSSSTTARELTPSALLPVPSPSS